MVLAKYGQNVEIDEDAQGRSIIRNTATGTEIALGDFVDIAGGLGSAASPVAGTSYFENTEHESVSTDDLQGKYPGKVRAITNGEVVTTIDPSPTDSPVQDAVDAIKAVATEGTILLPPGGVSENGTLTDLNQVTIQGHGKWKSWINFQQSGSATDHGVHLQAGDAYVTLRGFGIRGQGGLDSATTTGKGIYFGAEENGHIIEDIRVKDWSDDGIYSDSSAYNMTWQSVRIADVDGWMINFEGVGAGNDLGAITGGNCNGVYRHEVNGDAQIELINAGGTINPVNGRFLRLASPDDYNGTQIGLLNVEPDNAPTPTTIVSVWNQGQNKIERLRSEANASYAYRLVGSNGPGNCYLGRAETPNVTDKVNISVDPAGKEMFYEGPGSDVSVTHGGTEEGELACLADFTNVG